MSSTKSASKVKSVELEKVIPYIKPNIPNDNINICFVGGVSTGKSTGLNGVFCQKLTECKIKRTTMVPTVYVENENNTNPFVVTPPEEIYKHISRKNAEIIEKTETGQQINTTDYEELVFNVGKLDINIIEDSFVNVFDMPGLNDARTKSIYYDYLETNFHKFNLIIFFVDIHSGLNTSDEIDIVNFITTNTLYQKKTNDREIYTLVIVNKADDMQLDEVTDSITLTGELKEMHDQVERTIKDEFTKKNITKNLIGIIPLCAIDAYLYRMVRKFGCDFKLSPEQILKIGINENGKKFSTLKPAVQEQKVYEILNDTNFIETMIKLSGFSEFEKILHNFLKNGDAGKKIRINNLLYELKKLPTLSIDDFTFTEKEDLLSSIDKVGNIVDRYMNIYTRIKTIDEEIFETHVQLFYIKIHDYLQCAIRDILCSLDYVISYYDKFIMIIINPYFTKYYNVNIYSEYVKEHVIKLIRETFSRGVTDFDIIESFTILQKINYFTKEIVSELFSYLLLNPRTINTLTFEFETDNSLLTVLSDCNKIGVNMSEPLRFILLNKITRKTDLLYTRYLLYKRIGEIPLCEYIRVHMSEPSVEMVIRGIKEIDFENPNFVLDMFYLDYEKANRLNVVI
jgi:GTP-binding protein EngB required for normal cell division